MRTSRRMLRQARSTVVACLFFSGLITALMLAPPYFTVLLFKTVLPSGNFELLSVLAVMTAAAVITRCFLESCCEAMLMRASLWLEHNLGEHILANGLKIGRSSDDIQSDSRALLTITRFLKDGRARAVLTAIWIPVLIAALYVINPIFSSILSVATVCLAALSFRPADVGENNPTLNQDHSISPSLLSDAGLATAASSAWEKANRSLIANAYTYERAAVVNRFRSRALISITGIAVLCVAAHLMIAGSAHAGHTIAAMWLSACVLAPLSKIAALAASPDRLRASYTRLKALPADARMAPKLGADQLALTNVTYAYPGRSTPALKDVSVAISPGRCLRIAGKAGSGKSTLLAAFAGAIQPQTGFASIGGHAVSLVQRTFNRPPIGYAAADPVLIAGTVHQNIARFGPAPALHTAAAALRCGVHALIEQLPAGYETDVGPGGSHLSLRERQGVALARACHGSPLVCVLDQPELVLDDTGIRQLASTLQAMKADGCAIVMTTTDTRLAVIADTIAVLQCGSIETITHVSHVPTSGRLTPHAA